MQFLIGLILGITIANFLTSLAVRIALKVPSQPVQGAARVLARKLDIETGEKGKVVSLRNSSRVSAIMKGGSLTEALDQPSYDDAE